MGTDETPRQGAAGPGGPGAAPDAPSLPVAPLGHGVHTAGVLGAVVQMSPLAMVLTDPNAADCPVIFCNRAFVALTGFSEAETIGRNCRFLQGPDTDPVSVRGLGDAFRAGRQAQIDMWNYRKDGSRFWNSMFIGPVHDPVGRLLYYFGSQTDSSSRRAGEEAAHREHRMDTLGAMAAGMAHEVNNLMTVVIGNVELMRKAGLTEKQAQRMDHVAWAANAAGKLTQQMLSFAGRQGLHTQLVDLNDVVRGLNQLLSQVSLSPSGIRLAPHAPTLLAEVDVGQLELALLNLVRNAADASAPDAPITVTTGTREEDGMHWADISVSDRGSGMSPAVAARAMDPFFTTKEHGRGTGLGLSMVSGICQQSGGRLNIHTQAGRGTTVRMSFPLRTR